MFYLLMFLMVIIAPIGAMLVGCYLGNRYEDKRNPPAPRITTVWDSTGEYVRLPVPKDSRVRRTGGGCYVSRSRS